MVFVCWGEREQFVLKYLRAYEKRCPVKNGGLRGIKAKKGQPNPDFEPAKAQEVTYEEATRLLGEYCPDGKNSRILQKCFIEFM